MESKNLKKFLVKSSSQSVTYWVHEVIAESEEQATNMVLNGEFDDNVIENFTEILYDTYSIDDVEEESN